MTVHRSRVLQPTHSAFLFTVTSALVTSIAHQRRVPPRSTWRRVPISPLAGDAVPHADRFVASFPIALGEPRAHALNSNRGERR